MISSKETSAPPPVIFTFSGRIGTKENHTQHTGRETVHATVNLIEYARY